MDKPSAPASASPKRLGRGLTALLGNPVAIEPKPRALEEAAGPAAAPPQEAAEETGRLVHIDLQRISPSPFQPRKHFDQGSLSELAASIRSAGVMQPVVVRRIIGSGGGAGKENFELIAGERRWRAAQLVGLATIPAIIADVGDETAAEWALIENLQRADLSSMERARALAMLCSKFGLTHAQVAERVGLDRSSVTNLIRLTDLERPIQDALDAGRLTIGHGKALLTYVPGHAREMMAKRAIEQGWSIRKLESVIASTGREVERPRGKETKVLSRADAPDGSAAVRELEKQLGEHLGTRVRIRTRAGGKKGSLSIDFYDLDHFDGLMSKFGFVMK